MTFVNRMCEGITVLTVYVHVYVNGADHSGSLKNKFFLLYQSSKKKLLVTENNEKHLEQWQTCQWLNTRVPWNNERTQNTWCKNLVFTPIFVFFPSVLHVQEKNPPKAKHSQMSWANDESCLLIALKKECCNRTWNSKLKTPTDTHAWTHTSTSVPCNKWLMSSGRGSWAAEVQSGSDLIDTSRHEHHLHALTSHTRTPLHTHTHSHTHFNMWHGSFHAVYYIMSFFPPAAEGQGEQSESGTAAQRALHSFGLRVSHCGPAWGCFWQQPLQQIIEQQMKTNDMIAERVPAVNPLSRWFPFKGIDQLYNLSSWPGN